MSDKTANSDAEEPAKGLPSVSPDIIEQEHGDEIDNTVPTRGYNMGPMVGLGGSAGCIPALQQFFSTVPSDTGMIFVVILHLSREHESILAEVLGRSTTMPVVQAEDGAKVEPNRVYVIPPGKYLVALDGHLQLHEIEPARGSRVAVDLFFRSLADTHGPHAAAIILSGSDGDGTIGIKRIKERGGLTIAQDPDEAQHPSMPRSAIATGMVDWVLEVAQMPPKLIEYQENGRRLKLPPEEGPPPMAPPAPRADESETKLRDILFFLRTKTGRDFYCYKRATVVRRISRRMQVNGVRNMTEYLAFLRTHQGEAGALLQDLLISVTNFFRDRAAFAALEARLPELFAGKTSADSLRVWVPACATGEEAYSIAMLLMEHARTLKDPPTLHVFGCDLDEAAVHAARAGRYPEAITADVSEERIRNFFTRDAHGYRIRRELREIVLFASHDLLKDAPFSRMDLISCRNLLIYLATTAQDRVLETFAFALRHGGLLFLGTSETVTEGSAVFEILDRKHRLYIRRGSLRGSMPGIRAEDIAIHKFEDMPPGPVIPWDTVVPRKGLPAEVQAVTDCPSPEELHFKLLERVASPSLIVNGEYDIIHMSEQAGRFLQHSRGEPSANLLTLVNPMLRIELRAALFRAVETQSPVEVTHVPAEVGGDSVEVDIRVSPAGDVAPGFMLVIFELRPAGPSAAEKLAKPPEPAVQQLERELVKLKTDLRDLVEQFEASNEELKASNEELQAMNEELRAATEELESGREELQSVNEELSAVNDELKGKVEQLAQSNTDLNATSIPTLFLDRALHIVRYTPPAVSLFNMIPGDVGRPLDDLKHQLDYPELAADARHVLADLKRVEREVPDNAGRWFLARVLPYRTLEDYIAGVVLTFVEITALKKAERALDASEARFQALSDESKPRPE